MPIRFILTKDVHLSPHSPFHGDRDFTAIDDDHGHVIFGRIEWFEQGPPGTQGWQWSRNYAGAPGDQGTEKDLEEAKRRLVESWRVCLRENGGKPPEYRGWRDITSPPR